METIFKLLGIDEEQAKAMLSIIDTASKHLNFISANIKLFDNRLVRIEKRLEKIEAILDDIQKS